MENFRRSPAWEKMAAELIENDGLLVIQNAMQVKVVCVLSETMKRDARKLPIYAEAEKIPAKYRWATDADAMITIYQMNIANFSEKQKDIALIRELLKILIDETSGERKVLIGDYDLHDFRKVVEVYGADWDKGPTLFDEVKNG
jgi:hypothetical protein